MDSTFPPLSCLLTPAAPSLHPPPTLGRRSGDSIDLVDPRSLAPLSGLPTVPGLATWHAPATAAGAAASGGGGGGSHSSATAADTCLPATNATWLPPTADEAWLPPLLRSCVRLMPHMADCGGFFVAAFRRRADATGTGDGTATGDAAGTGDATVAGDAKASEGDEVGEDGSICAESGDHEAPAEVAAGHRVGDASGLENLDPGSAEWRSISSFYGLRPLPGVLLRAPGRSAVRESRPSFFPASLLAHYLLTDRRTAYPVGRCARRCTSLPTARRECCVGTGGPRREAGAIAGCAAGCMPWAPKHSSG